ncbi:dihydrolipoamide acetyltransferase family protein [Carnimonas nigrificans]|uniref:dihydrolipoamide acetyltransferase family protein n=1 Tax=Carnimonas nigrificans TaxID=64323 RepID=UPI000470C565|nr:dihydrolipoamide acetyltransferase family protein [Carnimonas nigrificans]
MAISVVMPKLGLTMTEGVVEEWNKQEGDSVQKGDILCSISSEKLSQDIEAEASGTLISIVVPTGESAPCTAPIAYIGEAGEQPDSADEANTAAPQAATKTQAQDAPEPARRVAASNDDTISNDSSAEQRLFISKLARRMVREKQLDIRKITGTGGRGRITRRDVEHFLAQGQTTEAQEGAAQGPQGQSSSAQRTFAAQGFTGMRKAIAANMMQSLHSTAQVTLQRKVNVTRLLEFREEMKARVAAQMASGTFNLNVLLLKATALALRDNPAMNSRYDGEKLLHPEAINIGVAVALDEGLVVPVIGDVDKQPLSQLGGAFKRAVQEARSGTISSHLEGSFSITNLGAQGIEYFTPVLNPTETGILGVGAIGERLYLDDAGEVKVAHELPLSLTFDHQVVDGAPAAEFLAAIAAYLEAPYSLLL